MSLWKVKIVIYMIRNLISLLASPALDALVKNVLIISKLLLSDLAYYIFVWDFNVLHTVPKNNQTKFFLVQYSVSVNL